MLSLKTCLELINLLDNYPLKTIDRIFVVFDIEYMIAPIHGKFTKEDKINILYKKLRHPPEKGPFSNLFRMDLLQYMVDHFYRFEDDPKTSGYVFYKGEGHIEYEDLFSHRHKALSNSLKRDGYIIKERIIKKLLPEEIEEAQSEVELFILLDKFNLTVTKGHLEQAISNHSQGNWAGANSQFRPFIESLLIDICKLILPQNNCNSASDAIKLLSQSANPPFLRPDLNEVEGFNCKKPFIEGLWKRLHPEGIHPGLSDEEDSTFRYHISIVVAHYLLKRLEKWNRQ